MRGFWKHCGAVVSIFMFVLCATPVAAEEHATSEEAKAMLERAVAALQEDETAALTAFNDGTGGFKEKDLYVFCGNAGDGMSSAHGSEPWRAGKASLREQVDVNGKKMAPPEQESGDGDETKEKDTRQDLAYLEMILQGAASRGR